MVKGEFVNIGVVLREASPGLGESSGPGGDDSLSPTGRGKAAVRFTRDWGRVRCVDGDADLGLLEALEGEIAERLRAGVSALDPKGVLEGLEDTLSNSVQISPAGACLAENVTTEMDLLMKMYVESMRVPARGRVRTGRGAIFGGMRTEFERAGVWGMMRKRISVAAYTRAGDPLKIDCGYRPNGTIRMFQAVSLDGDVEAAKVLAYSAGGLRDGVKRVEGAELELTAVVEPVREVSSNEADERWERYRFGVETMEREAIRVVTVNDLARVAATARVEMGA